MFQIWWQLKIKLKIKYFKLEMFVMWFVLQIKTYSEAHWRHPRLGSFPDINVKIKKHQNSPIWLIYPTCCPITTSKCKKIPLSRTTQSSQQNKIFTHLIHFPYQNLKQFPWFPFIQFFSNIQRWNHAVSSYKFQYKVNSTPKFHTAKWYLMVYGCRTVSHNCSMTHETAVSQSVPSTWPVSLP